MNERPRPGKKRSLVVGLIVGTLLLLAGAAMIVAKWAEPEQEPAVVHDTAEAEPGNGWSLLWSDEFSEARWDTSGNVSQPDWSAYHNTYGDGNGELACLTPKNLSIDAGALEITAEEAKTVCPDGSTSRYSSGFLGSREVGRYFPLFGRYEIRAKIPHGQGLWPAFWLRHRDGAKVAEVDIMESFHSQFPGQVSQTLHFPATLGANVHKQETFIEPPDTQAADWHTYAVEIEPAKGSNVRFRFFVDDQVSTEYVDRDASSWTRGDQDRMWDIAVNLAVGGDWVGDPDGKLGYLPNVNRCSLTMKPPPDGDPDNCPTEGLLPGVFPAQYAVDFVRVSTRG